MMPDLATIERNLHPKLNSNLVVAKVALKTDYSLITPLNINITLLNSI